MMKLTKSGEPEDSNFNGDLFVGERDPNDDVYSFSVELENQSSSVYNTFVPVKVEAGIFPWVALVNEKGSSAVFCGPVDGSINTSYANFTVRINPESKAVFRVYCTIHDA
ncbi:uncharacterized protein [Venturia canescens]|uniref:uncharacterized protein n=1 Tax=Venturia canescens TaxID=32260 RepID=UPI001C9CB85E|nr:uncharacterized protein LOC122409788 [Venturia canescens]